MSRIRVLEVNLHLHEEGVLAVVQERDWKGHRRVNTILSRTHLDGLNVHSHPADVLRALAALLWGQEEPADSGSDPS